MGRVGDDAVHAGRGHQRDEVGQRRLVQDERFVERLRRVGRPRRCRSGPLVTELSARAGQVPCRPAGYPFRGDPGATPEA